MNTLQYISKSKKYKGVYLYKENPSGTILYIASLGSRCNLSNQFKTEREAAVSYDKMMISKGKYPANILKVL